MEKAYLSSEGLLADSFRLGHLVYRSGFRPTSIVAVWRGGAPIGIAVQEYLDYRGVATDHIAIRTSSYTGIDGRAREVAVHGLNYLVKNCRHEDSLLIVDDVFDSGRSVDALIKAIRKQSRQNTPSDIRVACPWYKPSKNAVDFEPDYFLHESADWLVFPHELDGLEIGEIREGKKDLANILDIFE